MYRLKDKVAVITGTNSRIGASIAELFSKKGATVVIVDLIKHNFNAVADRIVANCGQAIAILGDVSSLEDCFKAPM
jgi:3-oxoacyl-[acyl-carrier protein] reductase